MLYFALFKSKLFNDKNNYDRFLRIISVGTVVYVILKMILSSNLLVNDNNYGIYVYYVALLDLIICMYTFDLTNNLKNNIEKQDEKENNLVSHLSPTELLSFINKNDKNKINKINKINNINEYNNNPDIQLPTNNIYDNLINKGPLGNLMKNFDILNNIDIHNNMKDDNIILDEELTNNKLKNSNINIDDGELNNTELNNTEIESESDEESYFIPIYRSKKKKNDKPQFV
tara:strand:+ start:547 stop:1236 length:690 start_codon:yes stop_codon:yes gene_type:complete